MTTFTLTYQQHRDRQTVLGLLDNRKYDTVRSETTFKKCCGSIAYLSLFLLPEFELVDKGIYSIENVCQYVPGFFKYDMHTLLTKLGEIACGDITTDALQTILNLSTFYECFEFIKLKPSHWYKLFLWQYFRINNKDVSWDTVHACSTYDEAVKLFNGEVEL